MGNLHVDPLTTDVEVLSNISDPRRLVAGFLTNALHIAVEASGAVEEG